MQDVPQKLHPYWCFRDELTLVDGLIMKGNRVVVPSTLRQSTLDRLHDAHQGITLTLQRARRTVYWPKLQEDITTLIQLLTAFNTPFKKYNCFQRLPFGLSASAEIFCEHMDRILTGIPGTFPCADDVKVQGSTSERHDINLLETVKKAGEAGLKFNPN